MTRVPDDWVVPDALYAEAVSAGATRDGVDEEVSYWRERKKLPGEFKTVEGFFRTRFSLIAKRRETQAFAAASRPALARAGPSSVLDALSDRMRMLREQEACEEEGST